MKTWTDIISNVYRQKSERGWKELYWCIDLHDTIITGTYNKYNDGAVLYPYAKATLDYLFKHPDHITILWTSSHYTAIVDVTSRFDLKFNAINCNNRCKNTDICNFDEKFYFNFLLDDKAGFDGNNDWKEIYYALVDPEITYSTKNKRIMEDNWS